jgi:CHAD domain-containing protein
VVVGSGIGGIADASSRLRRDDGEMVDECAMGGRAAPAGEVTETEWQFDASDLSRVARWLEQSSVSSTGGGDVTFVPADVLRLVDVYLDTDDHRFHRAGYSLRLRRVGEEGGSPGEATLTCLENDGSSGSGVRIRSRLSERLENSDPRLLHDAAGSVGQRVRALAGTRPLRPLFEVCTSRRVFGVEHAGISAGQVFLDETSIEPASGGAPTRLQRVEVEAPEEARALVEPFVQSLQEGCSLEPAGLTKYEAGLQTSGIGPPQPIDLGATAITPEAPISAVALAVLRRHFQALLANEPGTRVGDDPEYLHDMRVATRRLRAAIALFEDVLPAEIVEVREELGSLGGILGAVRDLDVQLGQLDQWAAGLPAAEQSELAPLRAKLVRQRGTARTALLVRLDSARYLAFIEGFSGLLSAAVTAASGPGAVPARAVAPDLIERRHAAVRKAGKRIGPSSAAADYHRVRIRCKRFRYALEFLAELYPGESDRLHRSLVALQDILGLHQDAEVAVMRLRELALDSRSPLPVETVFAMGAVAERYRASIAELRRRFPTAFAKVSGKRWKSFRSLIESQRPAAAAAGRAGS